MGMSLVLILTSQELLLVVETVSLNSGQLMFVLLNDLLQSAVQILLLLLKKLLLLQTYTHKALTTSIKIVYRAILANVP